MIKLPADWTKFLPSKKILFAYFETVVIIVAFISIERISTTPFVKLYMFWLMSAKRLSSDELPADMLSNRINRSVNSINCRIAKKQNTTKSTAIMTTVPTAKSPASSFFFKLKVLEPWLSFFIRTRYGGEHKIYKATDQKSVETYGEKIAINNAASAVKIIKSEILWIFNLFISTVFLSFP